MIRPVFLQSWLFVHAVAFIPPLSGHDEEHKYDFQIESESGSDEEDLNEVREGKSVSLLKLVLVVCAIGIVLLFTITVVLCLGCRYCKRCVYYIPHNRLFMWDYYV